MPDIQDRKRIHPLVAGAAVSVIVVSLVGVAAMTGILPTSNSTSKTDTTASAIAASNAAVTAMPVAASATAANGVSSTNDINSAQKSFPASNLASTNQQSASTTGVNNGATNVSQNNMSTEPAPHKICQTCGIVESIRAIEVQEEHASGLGAVAGAVLGGVLGHQVGNGNGRSLATVAGAVGGGFAGNTIEKRTHTNTVYEVRVKMENGHIRTFKPSAQPQYREGDRVHISNGAVLVD